MIHLDKARCTGCAACMGLCPTGAIAIEDGVAVIAESLCNNCGHCLPSCPQAAIILVETVSPGASQSAAGRAIKIRKSQPAQAALRQPVMPAAQAALLWAGQELLPRLADLALDWIDRRTLQRTSAGSAIAESSRAPRPIGRENRLARGMRHRARRRQGRTIR